MKVKIWACVFFYVKKARRANARAATNLNMQTQISPHEMLAVKRPGANASMQMQMSPYESFDP